MRSIGIERLEEIIHRRRQVLALEQKSIHIEIVPLLKNASLWRKARTFRLSASESQPSASSYRQSQVPLSLELAQNKTWILRSGLDV